MTTLFERVGRLLRPVPPLPDDFWRACAQANPLARRMDAARQARLRALVAQFLARKTFSPVRGARLDDRRCALIALQACIPVLELGFDWLAGWREAIVYPGEFKVKRTHEDYATGVVTEDEDVRVGEAWERGPLVLSWADVELDLAQPWDGFNVVAHEIAHKLDMLDGAADGVPRLPAGIARRAWIEAFQRGYDRLAAAVARGRRTAIDPYAAESADEYFAVVSELHFSDPATLRRAEPQVAALLEAFYGTSPAPA